MAKTEKESTALYFWETTFGKNKPPYKIDVEHFSRKGSATQQGFYKLIGDVSGKDVLDVGCGEGALSVFLALKGARVTATDFSKNAVDYTAGLAAFNDVEDRVMATEIDALSLGNLNQQFDLIVGRFVLHHIEPFDVFARTLKSVLKPGGRCVFMENNASNPFLMFARKNLAGKMGIPRYGDDEEYPLQDEEIDVLKQTFARVEQYYPELIFFRKLDTYIFRHNKRFGPFLAMNKAIDRTLYKYIPGSRRLSYLQLVEMINGPATP